MRFDYEYRTSDNVIHDGTISAVNRERAFEALRQQGIRPSRMRDAPGLANALFGKGKRWIAIFVLAVIAVVALVYAGRMKQEADDTRTMVQDGKLPRHQIAGLPDDWTAQVEGIFPDELDRILALHALPGKTVEVASSHGVRPVDGEWIEVLKRVVGGMREEARAYLELGKSLKELEAFLDERQRMEASYRAQTLRQVASGYVSKDAANAIFAAMGLEPIK